MNALIIIVVVACSVVLILTTLVIVKRKKDNSVWKIFIREKSFKEKVFDTVMGFGIPGVTLFTLIKTSPFAGAAATTSSLAALGPFGMIAGICSLGVLMVGGLYLRPFYNFCKEILNKKKKRKNRKFFK